MSGFILRRMGMVMEPEKGNPMETEGTLNPAAARGPDGKLYLFPRLVSKGNYSRIGIVKVLFDDAGDPYGVERMGIALEPETDYELRSNGFGGCEDPRITFVEPLRHYVMTYTALSTKGPRIALAISEDLFHWQRLGLVTFDPYKDIEFNGIDDKDASVFPVAILDPSGQPALALLHRPLFPGTRPGEKASSPISGIVDLHRESIWISYHPMPKSHKEIHPLCHFPFHSRLAAPVNPWEVLKIGGGTPPILTHHGWLIFYHGVKEITNHGQNEHKLCYSAGIMILDKEHPYTIRYRSVKPIMKPLLSQERIGTVDNVVFPTGIDRRDDIGLPHRFDVYYGMADKRIGVARLDVPHTLPHGSATDLKK